MVSRKFTVVQHVDALMTGCMQTLFALRTLGQHGVPSIVLRAVFQAIVVNKLSYAVWAWWGYANCAGRLEASVMLFRWITKRVGSFTCSYLCVSR